MMRTTTKATAIITAAAMLHGCATPPPNTPGAGAGNTYTPVIDMGGVDMQRYAVDLDECRRYSSSINAQDAAVSGAVGGAILLGVLSAALGGNSRMNSQAATAGGFAGMSGQAARATNKQETVMGNCMAMRGYRVLDGSAAAPVAAYAASARPPAQQPTPAAAPVSENQRKAEAIALLQSCTSTPRAYSVAGSPHGAMEIFSIACADGRMMRVRCDTGTCRESAP